MEKKKKKEKVFIKKIVKTSNATHTSKENETRMDSDLEKEDSSTKAPKRKIFKTLHKTSNSLLINKAIETEQSLGKVLKKVENKNETVEEEKEEFGKDTVKKVVKQVFRKPKLEMEDSSDVGSNFFQDHFKTTDPTKLLEAEIDGKTPLKVKRVYVKKSKNETNPFSIENKVHLTTVFENEDNVTTKSSDEKKTADEKGKKIRPFEKFVFHYYMVFKTVAI